MKPSDWFLDLQDILGKIVPGLLILFEFLFFYQIRKPPLCKDQNINMEYYINIIKIITENIKDNWIMVIIASFIIGYYVSTLFYFLRVPVLIKVRKWFNCDIMNIKKFLIANDKTEGKIIKKQIIKTLTEKFSIQGNKPIQTNNYNSLHFYCKNSLVDSSPMGFKLLKRIEAHIEFAINMLMPLILAFILSLIILPKNLNLIVILVPIAILLSLDIRSLYVSRRNEEYLIFILFHADSKKP